MKTISKTTNMIFKISKPYNAESEDKKGARMEVEE